MTYDMKPTRDDPTAVGTSEVADAIIERMGVRVETKVTVIGAGNVGATAAQEIARRDYADVVLVDIKEGLPQGKALDLNEAGPVLGYEPAIVGTNGYEETEGSDIIVLTAGVPRTGDMSRDDLVTTNEGSSPPSRARPSSGLRTPSSSSCRTRSTRCATSRRTSAAGRASACSAWRASSTRPASAPSSRGRRAPHRRTCRRSSSAATATRWFRSSPRRPSAACRPVLVPRTSASRRWSSARAGGGEIVKLLGTAWYAPGAAVAQMVDASPSTRSACCPAPRTSRASTASKACTSGFRSSSGRRNRGDRRARAR